MKKLVSPKMIVLAAGMVAAARVASAATVTYTFTGETGGGEVIGIHTANDGNVSALVGQFIMTTSTPGFNSPLLTYCTDVGANLAYSYNYTPTALSSATGVAPAWISQGIQNAATLWFNDKNGATTAAQTAGLQLAIWELLYNAPISAYSVATLQSHSNNGFYVTTTDANSLAAMTDAVADLNSFGTLTSAANQVQWMAPTDANGGIDGSQGLLAVVPTTQDLPRIPEAASTMGLFGMALAALAAVRKIFSVRKG